MNNKWWSVCPPAQHTCINPDAKKTTAWFDITDQQGLVCHFAAGPVTRSKKQIGTQARSQGQCKQGEVIASFTHKPKNKKRATAVSMTNPRMPSAFGIPKVNKKWAGTIQPSAPLHLKYHVTVFLLGIIAVPDFTDLQIG